MKSIYVLMETWGRDALPVVAFSSEEVAVRESVKRAREAAGLIVLVEYWDKCDTARGEFRTGFGADFQAYWVEKIELDPGA